MPRSLEFDRHHARDQALQLFWSQGYQAASLNALLQTMGIGRGSFYASFGDKKSLFIECLQAFGRQTLALAGGRDGADAPPERVISAFFEASFRDVPEARLRRGCLLVNSILELADTDPALCQMATDILAGVERAFADALRQALAQGRLQPGGMTPEQTASFLMTVNQGLRVQCRKGLPRERIWSTAMHAMNLAGLEYPVNHAAARQG